MNTPVESPRLQIVMMDPKAIGEDHPWAACIPSSSKAMEVLTDMKSFGFRMECPVLVSSQGRLLKGRCRRQSAISANITPIPCIIVPCDDEQDEIDVIAREALTSRQLTPAQYELIAWEYQKTLSATLVKARQKNNAAKKRKKNSLSVDPTDRLAVGDTSAVVQADAVAPEMVVIQQRKRDARAETAKLFKVPEMALQRFSRIEKHTKGKRYMDLIRRGEMTPKVVEQEIIQAEKAVAFKKREETAAGLPATEGWLEGEPRIVLKELTATVKLAIAHVTHLAAVEPHLGPGSAVMILVDQWSGLKAAADGASRMGLESQELLMAHFPEASEPAAQIRGTVRLALLCRKRSVDLVGRIERVIRAGKADSMPPPTMLTSVINAITVANEVVLLTDGTTEDYLLVKKLARQPIVIASDHDEFLRGRIELADLKVDPPACLVTPGQLVDAPEIIIDTMNAEIGTEAEHVHS